MNWVEANWPWIVAAVLIALALVWLLRRRGAAGTGTALPPEAPRAPLVPAKPDIVVAEPARFNPREPAPASAASSEAAIAAPPPGDADNLQLLKGVGPKLVTLLHGLGVTRFAQIAAWTAADIAAIDPQLGAFQGRIIRDNWVDQAGYLARGDTAGFEARYGALGGEF